MGIAAHLIFALGLPTISGFLLLRALGRQTADSPAWSLAVAYGLGIGIVGQVMLALGIAPLTLSWGNITAGLLAVSLTCAVLIQRQKKPWIEGPTTAAGPAEHRLSWPERAIWIVCLCYIGYYTMFVCWRALNIPIFFWDAMATYAYKAKLFFYEQRLLPLDRLPHPSFPPLLSFLESWMACNLGRWDDQLIKIIFPPLFSSYLVIHHSFLKNLTGRAWAMAGTAMVVSAHFFVFLASVSLRDFLMMSYNCGTIILLLSWARNKNRRDLILAGFFSGMTTFTKLEGRGYILIHGLLLLVILHQSRCPTKAWGKTLSAFLLPGLGLLLPFWVFTQIQDLPVSVHWIMNQHVPLLARVPLAIKSFTEELFLSADWNILWGLLLLSLPRFFHQKDRSPETGLLLICLTLFFTLYLFLALFTPNFKSLGGSDWPDVLPRVILHFFPLCPLAICLIHAPNTDK